MDRRQRLTSSELRLECENNECCKHIETDESDEKRGEDEQSSDDVGIDVQIRFQMSAEEN